MKKRISVYIDGANFFGGINNFNKFYFDTNFDFENYIKSLIGKDNLIQVYYYNGYLKKKINPNVWGRQNTLFNRLKKLKKWKVFLFRKQKCDDEEGTFHFKMKEDDLNLAINALSDAYEDRFDKMILISSDRDFIPLIKQIQKIKKEISICYFQGSTSNRVLNLFQDKDKLKITKNIVKKYFLSPHMPNYLKPLLPSKIPQTLFLFLF